MNGCAINSSRVGRSAGFTLTILAIKFMASLSSFRAVPTHLLKKLAGLAEFERSVKGGFYLLVGAG